ncbi:MAG: hypothetical protein IJ207_12165 [Treponema sp.]|uniref:hypothetical protein n=1 Tax=Treponema sp. TaxID=166 RepID=UPI0025FF0326|nr:hypothetical protein [Treponema sp.]MBQ9282927.1 hypothetical protein [Treponema sp.]
MKKIVSVLSVAALTLSAVFAADVSLNYKMAGTLYKETNTKEIKTEGGDPELSSTRTFLDLNGYSSTPSGDLEFTAKNDFAGFALTLNPKVNTAYTAFDVDTYYGWLNFAGLQLTSGKWTSRYVALLDDDGGNWEDNEFARYKPGVIGGKYAYDIDNLTQVRFTNTAGETDWEQRLSTALAYTIRPDDDTYFMIKGVLVDSDWGSTLRTDSDRTYGDDYAVGNGDLNFFSGFAGEVAFRTAAFDINFAAKSMYRDELGLGVFFRTIGDTSLLFGLSAGLDLSDTEDVNDSNYREFAFDFRGRFKLSEKLTLTTMNNLSVLNNAKAKDQDYDEMDFHLWDMVSIAYQANEKVLAQLTVESECDPLLIRAENTEPGDDWTATNNGAKGSTTFGASATGGFTITVTPGVTYSFNENATLTAGVAIEWAEIGASPKFRDSVHTTTTTIQVPVVFKVAL